MVLVWHGEGRARDPACYTLGWIGYCSLIHLLGIILYCMYAVGVNPQT